MICNWAERLRDDGYCYLEASNARISADIILESSWRPTSWHHLPLLHPGDGVEISSNGEPVRHKPRLRPHGDIKGCCPITVYTCHMSPGYLCTRWLTMRNCDNAGHRCRPAHHHPATRASPLLLESLSPVSFCCCCIHPELDKKIQNLYFNFVILIADKHCFSCFYSQI